MTVFISHSTRDHAAVRALAQHLQTAHESVWLDQSLIGGEAWWQRILHQIRSCTVFVVALSNSTLQSKPCRAEMDYAKTLGLPVLPVIIGDVDSYRLDPIFTVQSVDFRNPDAASGAALVAAVRERAAERKALPDPLPDPPPIPYEYLQRLGVAIDSPEELSPTEQSTILADLRHALRQEDDESIRGDIRRLLHALRRRSEVTLATVYEIDDLLRRYPTVGGNAVTVAASESTGGSTAESLRPLADSRGHPANATANTESTKPRSPMNPKTLAIAGGALVVVTVIAVVASLLMGRSPQNAAANRPATTTPSPPPPVAVAALDGLLLTATEINTALGTTGVAISPDQDPKAMADDSSVTDNKNCLAMANTAEKPVYADSGYTSTYVLSFRDDPDINITKYLVNESVVSFPSANDAAKFFTASSQRWPACSNLVYHAQSNGGTKGTWSVGPVSNMNGTLSATQTQEGVDGWACQRALTVANNVAVDVASCGYKPDDSGVTIAHQIAAKVAKAVGMWMSSTG